MTQPHNTPLNADDELREKVQDICDRIGAGLLPPTGAGAIMQLILADRKKHELQTAKARLEKDIPFLEEMKHRLDDSQDNRVDLEGVQGMVDDWLHELKQELESYE